jgi:hypothetical protein
MSLEDLKKRMQNAQPIAVGPDGKIHNPNDPKVEQMSPDKKTMVKPTRWY